MEKQPNIEDISKKISEDIQTRFDGETTATIAAESNIKDSVIFFTVEEMRKIPYNIRMFYWIFKNRYPEIDNYIEQGTFLEIIHFLRNLCDQKREQHKCGANFIICADENDINLSSTDSGVPVQLDDVQNPFSKNSGLAAACKHTDTTKSFFMFRKSETNSKIEFRKLKDFSKNDTIINSMKNLCHRPNIGFSLESGSNSIRIFYDEDLRVEYFLSETTGSWTIRFKDDILGLINSSHLNENESIKLTNHVINLSYKGAGAMIIITKDASKFDKIASEHQNKMSLSLISPNTDNHFVDYATNDGAVIIECKQFAIIRYVGISISPTVNASDPYQGLLKKTLSGSRHEKAAQYACENPDDYLIVVSENKTISFLHGETPIYWRDEYVEPNYQRESKEEK